MCDHSTVVSSSPYVLIAMFYRKYGPMPRFPHQRVWTRAVMILALLTVVYFTSKNGKEVSLAKQHEVLHQRKQAFDCSESYKSEVEHYPGESDHMKIILQHRNYF